MLIINIIRWLLCCLKISVPSFLFCTTLTNQNFVRSKKPFNIQLYKFIIIHKNHNWTFPRDSKVSANHHECYNIIIGSLSLKAKTYIHVKKSANGWCYKNQQDSGIKKQKHWRPSWYMIQTLTAILNQTFGGHFESDIGSHLNMIQAVAAILNWIKTLAAISFYFVAAIWLWRLHGCSGGSTHSFLPLQPHPSVVLS